MASINLENAAVTRKIDAVASIIIKLDESIQRLDGTGGYAIKPEQALKALREKEAAA